MNINHSLATLATLALVMISSLTGCAQPTRVTIASGILQGTTADNGVRTFKGIPFAQPPIRELRWKPPQPVKPWTGIREAKTFGPRPMQRPLFADMVFRSPRVSEDCLYLNVWTPAKSTADSSAKKLPVLVYFYGGGFQAGDGSEPRYDGASMARRGIVSVTVNYRLNVFGFLAHPELSQEASGASGNYGLLDQLAALRWVRDNIAAFGGDPDQVTIAGESAGSMSVCAHMASPQSNRLFARAIGESGAILGTLSPSPLDVAEQKGLKFAELAGARSLADLRAIPAERLLALTADKNAPRFGLTIDGRFLVKPPLDVFTAGEQAKVPLLVGWNTQEGDHKAILKDDPPTIANFERAVRTLYPDHADEVLKVYHASSDGDVEQVATDLASDRFIAFATWKWADVHATTSKQPVYRYLYAHPRPPMRVDAIAKLPPSTQPLPPTPKGAVHSAEIEYALGNLKTNEVFAWTDDDQNVSATMKGYFASFIKTGNPFTLYMPIWPPLRPGANAELMRFDVNSRVEIESHRERYLLLDRMPKQPR